MQSVLRALLTFLATLYRSRLSMPLEIMALRHQLSVYQRSARRPQGCSMLSALTDYWHMTGSESIEQPWLRDRDGIYGVVFQRRVTSLGIEEVRTAPRSPWQNPFAERLIGSIRRDCLDHVIVFNERHLKRLLSRYFEYYHHWRTHLSLSMDSPESRPVQLPARDAVIEYPEVGGLHHHYERRAA